ncbi:MAG: hypothetical protein EON56_05175 [Alphaproteobacteria bacterium]|nr:MAG: hypothetical protein EON56_05175 [Alphaproteobacteria bacterium]
MSADKMMQSKVAQGDFTETKFRYDLKLHMPLEFRKVAIEVHLTDVQRPSRSLLASEQLNYPSDYHASFEAHARSKEVYITILHWLNATFITVSATATNPKKLGKQFEDCPRNQKHTLPSFIFIGNPKKDIRSQRISTIPAVARMLEAA